MLLEAAVLDAAEMKSRGFLHAVVAEAALADEVIARCRRIAALAPAAARLNKQALRAVAAGQPQRAAYDYAPDRVHREGIAAFLEKRKPEF
jgi:enoyl-CoA hydratase/carnithine racemase